MSARRAALAAAALAAVALEGRALPESADAVLARALVGVWHAAPSVGAGHAERYRLYPDGRFVRLEAEAACAERERERSGTWRVRAARLELTATARRVLVGGRVVDDPVCGGPALEGARLETWRVSPARAVALAVGALRPPDAASPYPSRTLGPRRYWRLTTNPGG